MVEIINLVTGATLQVDLFAWQLLKKEPITAEEAAISNLRAGDAKYIRATEVKKKTAQISTSSQQPTEQPKQIIKHTQTPPKKGCGCGR